MDGVADARDIVLAAIGAAGSAGSDLRAWQRRVTALVPAIGVMLAESKYGPVEIAQAASNATGFAGEFVEYEMEESSSRAIITIRTKPSKDYPEGLEPLRTYPTWSDYGYQQVRRVKELAKGDRLFVYKIMEKMGEGREVRVLAHFEVIGAASSRGTSSPTPPTDQTDAGPAASVPTEGSSAPAPPRSATSAPDAQHGAAVEESMKGFTNPQKIAVAKRCNAAGIASWVVPSDDDLDKVLLIIQQVRKGE